MKTCCFLPWVVAVLSIGSGCFGLLDADTPFMERFQEARAQSTGGNFSRVNDRVVFLAAERERREGSFGSIRRSSSKQLVVLDFESETTIGEFNYSDSDRGFIISQLKSVFGNFDIDFSEEEPSDSRALFSRITFNDGPQGGRADNVDFCNKDQTDTATVNVNGLSNSNFQWGYEVDASANIAMHQLGHLLGIRHADSFGPLGAGLPTQGLPGTDSYLPAYTGPQNANETVNHIMAFGQTFNPETPSEFNAVNIFMGERERIKLTHAFDWDTVTYMLEAQRQSDGDGIILPDMYVQNWNRLDSGKNSGSNFLFLRSLLVPNAALSLAAGEVDNYRIQLTAGQTFQAETISLADVLIAKPFDTQLTLTRESDGTIIAFNDDEFETFGSVLMDIPIEQSGIHVLSVRSSVPFTPSETGEYMLLVYTTGPEPIGSQCGSSSYYSPYAPNLEAFFYCLGKWYVQVLLKAFGPDG